MHGTLDCAISVNKNGLTELAGEALVRVATGETINDRELGDSHMHAGLSERDWMDVRT